MSSTIVHALQMAVHDEPGAVTLDLMDEPGFMGARLRCTPGQALKIAAQIMEAAEKAECGFWEESA